jgi:hypothetical protein
MLNVLPVCFCFMRLSIEPINHFIKDEAPKIAAANFA